MNKVIKNAGISSKKAAEGFRLFGEAMKDVQPTGLEFPTHSARIWSEKTLDHAEDARFYSEYMQQPIIRIQDMETVTSCSNHEEIAENLDRITERVERMTDKVDNMMGLVNGPPEPELPDQCPNCMQMTTWDLKDYNNIAICDLCAWEFDAWALSNIPLIEMRTNVLELRLRQTQQQLELENSRHNEARGMEPQASRPIPNPGGRDLASEIRTLMANRDLTSEQMQHLSELIGEVQESPPPRLHSSQYAEDYAPEPRLRPISGRGITGDAVLEGNEERLMFFDEAADWKEAENFFEPKEKDKPVKPLVPPKRKLDI